VEVTCFGVPSKVVLGIESGPTLAEALFHGRFQRRAWVELAPGLWPARRASEFLAVAEDLMMARATTAGLADLFTVGIGRDDLDVAAGTDGAVFVSLREDSAAAVLAAIRDEIATGRWPGGAAHDRWLRQWHGALDHLLQRGCCVFGHVG